MEANQRYNEILTQLETNIELLKEKIIKHSEKQSKEPNHWGYVGDISYVNTKIENILETIK